MAVVVPRAGLDGRGRALSRSPFRPVGSACAVAARGSRGCWRLASVLSGFVPSCTQGRACGVRGLVALGSYILVPKWLSVLGRLTPGLPTSL